MVLPATGLEIILLIPIERGIVLNTNLKEERSGGHHAATTAGIRYYLLRICTATGHSTILCPDSSRYQHGVPAPRPARPGGMDRRAGRIRLGRRHLGRWECSF